LLDSQTGEVVSEVKKLAGLTYFTALAFSFDDRFMIAMTNAGETAVLQVDEQGKLQHAGNLYRHAKGANVLSSSPRYLFAASGGRDGTIAWQTLKTPSQTRLLQSLKREPLAIWLPSEGVEAWAVNGERLLKFSLRDATVLDEHELKNRSARAACFSPDGSHCVLLDYRDILWIDLQGGFSPVKIYKAEGDSLSAAAFHPNNRWIAVSGRGNVLLLDVIDREPLARIEFDSVQTIKCLQFSPDGNKLAVSYQSSDGNLRLFEVGAR
jgi:WD40 repeat protein